MKKAKNILILLLLLSIFIFISAYSYVSAISTNLYDSIFRLHVIANSNSTEDQNLKYIVRDSLVNYINNQKSKFSTKEDVFIYVKNNLDTLKSIAQSTIYEQGYTYPVSVDFGNFKFPTKTYGDISFPSGNYDGLKVKIGSAKGQNWWCVMFPPLCFVNTTDAIVPDESKSSLENTLSEENYRLVSETKNSGITIKFKIVELFERSGIITAKK